MTTDLRDEQLRGSLLRCANRFSGRAPDGWVSGSKLAISARDDDRVGVDDEAHAQRLLDELMELLLIDEKPGQPTGGIGKRELRHRLYKPTQLGWRLLMGQIDLIPGVATGGAE